MVKGNFKELWCFQTTYMKKQLLNTHFPDEETKAKKDI